MRILYIEPTSTELLSEHYETLLNEAASPGTTVKVKNLSGALRKQGTAPPLLPTFWGEGVFQLGEMFQLIQDAQGKFNAIIIGCSADPGLRLAKRLARPMPVVAPFEAALHLAAGWPYSPQAHWRKFAGLRKMRKAMACRIIWRQFGGFPSTRMFTARRVEPGLSTRWFQKQCCTTCPQTSLGKLGQ